MLEGLVAWVLNNYLGKYVENLNTAQLSIALLSGEVELEQLPLRRDALRHLGVPVEIRAGFIGKVRLQVPVRALRSAPWVIAVERLYVVAGPVRLEHWDSGAEHLAEHERKLTALDTLEACWRNETDNGTSTYYASSYSSWLNYGTGVISDIVENLQLRINDVHIRYEDAGEGIACGMLVKSLSAQTCDEQWRHQFTHSGSGDGHSYKTIDLTSLALYWDHVSPDKFMSDMSMSELATAMATEGQHHYIVAPVSGYAHVKRNQSEFPLRSLQTPRLVCELHLSEVPILLADWQYEQLVRAMHTLEFVSVVQNYRRFRPAESVKEDPKAWWMYGVRCLCPNAWPGRWTRRANWWEQPLEIARENCAYVRLYETILAVPSGALSHQDKRLKEHVEWTRDLEELKALREAAIKRVPSPVATAPQNLANGNSGKSMLVQWFPGWWYGSGNSQQAPATTEDTKQLEGQLLEALGEAVRDSTLLKRDAVFGRFSFTLKRGALSLCKEGQMSLLGGTQRAPSIPQLELQYEDFQLSVEFRPRSGAHMFELGLGALCLKDLLTPDTLFPVLVGPPDQRTNKPNTDVNRGPLFHLSYECSGRGERKLRVRSQPLDVVYHPGAARWLSSFTRAPQRSLEEVKSRTKKHIIKNWENIASGQSAQTCWDIQLDVSAPQIIFVERFTEKHASIAVVDLGRLHVTNADTGGGPGSPLPQRQEDSVAEEDDEMWATPCSTPPGSENSRTDSMATATGGTGPSEVQLQARLYERYTAELSDIQVLTCRVKDGWRHAHLRGSSAMHVLDKFSITVRCERRLVKTADPMYPAFTLAASLPRLVLHVNEHKVTAVRTLFNTVLNEAGLSDSPFNSPDLVDGPSGPTPAADEDISASTDDTNTPETADNMNSRLLMLQLSVETVSLQVQSRGRSVAELQITGASVTFTRRPQDTGLTLTVHGLLLVDALQTYGPDFELLVASHRHVGMDSVSGSLRDSEPTSPMSPASPDPAVCSARRATSPVALSRALSGLATTSPPLFNMPLTHGPLDMSHEALICVEYTEVQGTDTVRIANIQFNNLDITANQETIVELVGFVRRVFPVKEPSAYPHRRLDQYLDLEEPPEDYKPTKMELTFDFHRLNVLVMRGVSDRNGEMCGRKVATATMSEARIQATVEDGFSSLAVRGSLGGLQVLDLTPEGSLHRRVVSVGRDPLAESPHTYHYNEYGFYTEHGLEETHETKALEVNIARGTGDKQENVEIQVRMASVWYTHSPQLLAELQSCVAEFKQYLSNVARSIKAAASEMALGLVHARPHDTLYQRSGSQHGLADSPLHRNSRRRSSTSLAWHKRTHSYDDDLTIDADETIDDPSRDIKLKVDVVLDSPVVVLPRNPSSTQVFVAHLGRISVKNLNEKLETENRQIWDLEVRDMNLYSLDTAARRVPGPVVPRADQLYSCDTLAEPVLHDTIVKLQFVRKILYSTDMFLDKSSSECLEVSGSVVNALRVSLTRAQYEQLLDTFKSLSVVEKQKSTRLADIREEGTDKVRAGMFLRGDTFRPVHAATDKKDFRQFHLKFELPVFIIELRQGDKAVDLSLSEFVFSCERTVPHETNIQVSLRSLHMDDLGEDEDSRLRHMVVSTAPEVYQPPMGVYVSHSCPEIAGFEGFYAGHRHEPMGSLPDHLVTERILGAPVRRPSRVLPPHINQQVRCPETPPPSTDGSPASVRPITDNLVLVSCLLVDPDLVSPEDFATTYGRLQQSTQVDFNSLNMIVRPQSWTLVLDFFSDTNNQTEISENTEDDIHVTIDPRLSNAKSDLSISVRSLTLNLVRADGGDIARANISGVRVRKVTNLSNNTSNTDGRLGSMSIVDLTSHGRLYRERFQTLGERALHFSYGTKIPKENEICQQLRIEMATVLYVHTRKFILELQLFFSGFGTHKSQPRKKEPVKTSRMSLEVQAGAPVILLPVSSNSPDLLVADLGRLSVTNTFKDSGGCPLEIMSVELLDMDLYTACRVPLAETGSPEQGLRLGGGAVVRRTGRSLLDDKCRLLVTVERNLSNGESTAVPGLSIRGDLSTLQGTLELAQYSLIRGLLAHNIGENVDDLLILESIDNTTDSQTSDQPRCTLTLLQLGLQNVTVRLSENGGEPLASIHFISSKLTVENFSDGAQDIDLLSQEIVLVDTRRNGTNVFTNILRPGTGTASGMEIHSRKRTDQSEFTVLLNNMHVFAVPDWWQHAREYIFSPPLDSGLSESLIQHPLQLPQVKPQEIPYELKLNVTNSEIVVVQDSARLDTNALTLRSTTVISWRPNSNKPLSCNLNHCELFSCVPGKEQDTALSIIDPVTVGVELSETSILEIQIQQQLTVRLSYHDCLMLTQMAKSVPQQTRRGRERSNSTALENKDDDMIRRLAGLGFSIEDCGNALQHCNGQLEDAALWLTQHAIHSHEQELQANNSLTCDKIIVRASCFVLTIIDDCGDADVPLAEVCLAELTAEQPMNGQEDAEGSLECKLSCDYYNRALSGWEPCLEPWKCKTTWEMRRRVFINVLSDHLLDVNITTSLLELYRLVSDNWSKDMMANSEQDGAFRQRRRFIPFALKNDTGSEICFTTVVTSRLEDDSSYTSDSIVDDDKHTWVFVKAGETVPFEFGDSRTGKRRHGDTHRARLHRLRVQVAGWQQPAYVSVDRVGVFFRDVCGGHGQARARLVFDVRLEGSARKLITVRSALLLVNKLPDSLDVRLGVSTEVKVGSGETFPIPLEYSHQQLHVRTTIGPYCQPDIDWRGESQRAGDRRQESRSCGQRGKLYHLVADICCEHTPGESTLPMLPAHTITVLPALLLVNLLPHELQYTVREGDGGVPAAEGVVAPGQERAVSSADPCDQNLELLLRLEGFRCCAAVLLPRPAPGTSGTDSQCRVRLEDSGGRKLNLQAAITARGSSAALRVAISSPYWIVNKTGLPLVFRQEGLAVESAGQFEEHEVARMVAPLLFSWADSDASPSVSCRVGGGSARGAQPHWCQHFHLRRGVQVRRLRVSHAPCSDGSSRPDHMYVIGIEVRPGKGRYRRTNIVTLSARYQLHNRSTRGLIFSQQCHATTVSDPGARATHVEAVPGCQVAFHWPRLDRDQLLCVRLQKKHSLWSGGIRIDTPRSLHVSIREEQTSALHFLRLEVVARGATLHAVFGDAADSVPPPLRVDNRSEVSVTFCQQDVPHLCVSRAGQKVPYAWDEPDRWNTPLLLVSAPGGATAVCDMDKLGPVAQLTYENFIYVAFTGTFGDCKEDVTSENHYGDITSSPECQRLVLDVTDEGGQVSLAVKQPGRRSQLWRMTSTGQLQHEGSPADRVLVLDIADPAPQPSRRDSRLALRRPDPRRRSTQTWRFTADGRLCCAHENMCVQSAEGLWGLRSGGVAVLGVPREPPPHRQQRLSSSGVPLEQAVGKQRMRPGSGFLSVEVGTDGPTRVLLVRDDMAERLRGAAGAAREEEAPPAELRLVVRLVAGLGASVVARGPPQELIYARLTNIVAELGMSAGPRGSRHLCLSVADIQCDNQLFDTDTEVVVYVSKSRGGVSQPEARPGPALSVSAELQNPQSSALEGPAPTVHICRHLVVKVNPLAVHIEETLLLRLLEFAAGAQGSRTGGTTSDTPDTRLTEDETRPGVDDTETSQIKYYFGVISLAPGPIRLSMRTAGKLPPRLRQLRKRLGLTLIQFEDAQITLEQYIRRHSFDTWSSTWQGVYAHFKEELLWQAAVILGNVDFLGGPLGLVNDVTEGVSGLINDRSVGALVMNVTHGISNSAAKVTDALGDGLGRVLIMDEVHEETRQRIRRTAAPAGHLVAGIKGLGFGLLDGATGLFRHVYEGASQDGVQGAFAGVGRGLVGIVAKPVVGVLDLAGEAARAVRDSSRGSGRAVPDRKRLPRVAAQGPGDLLQRYGSGRDARGQKYLHQVNGGNRSERFVAYGGLRRSGLDDLRLIVGSERVRVVTRGTADTLTVVTEVRLEEVSSCVPVCEPPPGEDTRWYVELAVGGGTQGGGERRPRIRCDTEEVAKWAARQVNFARRMLSERRFTLYSPDGGDVTTPM